MGFKPIFKFIIFAILISLTSSIVFAQNGSTSSDFDASDSYLWLTEQCEAGNCNDDLMATSFYAVAMKRSGYGNTYGMQAIKYIQSQMKESDSCFPISGCDPKETAFAYWALSEYGEPTAGIEDYLYSSLGVGLTDNWWLEIITSASDQYCTIGYPKGGEQEQKDILVDEGTFPECNQGQQETYFDLNACIEPNLLNSNPSLELTIDCSSIGQGTIISIVYNIGSNFYLTEQATTSKYKTQVQNACHTQSNTCNKDSSLWANWVLNSRNSEINTNLYLLTIHDSLSPVDSSLLYLTTTDTNLRESFLEELNDLQRLDGSFNEDNFQTAAAVLAYSESGSTEQLNMAIEYLKGSRRSDGSWDGSEINTAIVLYSAFTGSSITLPPLGQAPSGSQPPSVCGDAYCDPAYEDEYTCPKDCEVLANTDCNNDGVCEPEYHENALNCASDCYCGDGICDSTESATCSLDCEVTETVPETYFPEDSFEVEEERGFPWLLILILLLLISAAFLAYKHYFKKEKKSKTFKKGSPYTPPRTPQKAQPARGSFARRPVSKPRAPSKKTKSELELEKSIKEAQKLLGK